MGHEGAGRGGKGPIMNARVDVMSAAAAALFQECVRRADYGLPYSATVNSPCYNRELVGTAAMNGQKNGEKRGPP